MARPEGKGLSYFPLDTDIDDDDKIYMIEAEHGLEGYAVIIKLLIAIYKEGYYKSWNEKDKLVFAGKRRVPVSLLDEVIKTSFKAGLLNEELYSKYEILTSHGIQIRYLKASIKKRNIDIKKEYMLFNYDEIPEGLLNKITFCSIFTDETLRRNNGDYSRNNDETDPCISAFEEKKPPVCGEKIPQIKAKQNKINKSKANRGEKTPFLAEKIPDSVKDPPPLPAAADFNSVKQKYRRLGLSFDDNKIKDHLSRYGPDIVLGSLKAFSERKNGNISKSPEAYFTGILKTFSPEELGDEEHEIKIQQTKEALKKCDEDRKEVNKIRGSPEYQKEAERFFKFAKNKSKEKELPPF